MARPRSDIAPRILTAARRRFLREGVDGASLRGIAEEARTSIGMVYYYFPSKDDLFLAVVEEVYLGLLHDLERLLAPGRPVPERIEALYRRMGAVSALERQVIRLVLREALTSAGRLERLIERFQRGHVPLLVNLVGEGFATGLFKPELPPPLVLAVLMAIGGPAQVVLGVMADRLSLPVAPRGADLAALLVQLLLGGVGRSPSETYIGTASPAPRRVPPRRHQAKRTRRK